MVYIGYIVALCVLPSIFLSCAHAKPTGGHLPPSNEIHDFSQLPDGLPAVSRALRTVAAVDGVHGPDDERNDESALAQSPTFLDVIPYAAGHISIADLVRYREMNKNWRHNSIYSAVSLLDNLESKCRVLLPQSTIYNVAIHLSVQDATNDDCLAAVKEAYDQRVFQMTISAEFKMAKDNIAVLYQALENIKRLGLAVSKMKIFIASHQPFLPESPAHPNQFLAALRGISIEKVFMTFFRPDNKMVALPTVDTKWLTSLLKVLPVRLKALQLRRIIVYATDDDYELPAVFGRFRDLEDLHVDLNDATSALYMALINAWEKLPLVSLSFNAECKWGEVTFERLVNVQSLSIMVNSVKIPDGLKILTLLPPKLVKLTVVTPHVFAYSFFCEQTSHLAAAKLEGLVTLQHLTITDGIFWAIKFKRNSSNRFELIG